MTLSASVPDAQPGGTLQPVSPVNEDEALSLLKSADLLPEEIERISKNPAVKRSRKVRLALCTHPHAPRYISIPLIRHLFTFDLMRVALTPAVPADVKIAAEESLINRLETLPEGEKLSLAKRASGRVAGVLVLERETRVMRAALENPRLSEAALITAVIRHEAPAPLISAVCIHSRWSVRRDVRIALLRAEKTPLVRALEFSRSLPPQQVREVLNVSRLPLGVKALLWQDLERRA
jgi:hypothetical protein